MQHSYSHLRRRKALAALAAVPATFAVCAPLSFAEGEPGELASYPPLLCRG